MGESRAIAISNGHITRYSERGTPHDSPEVGFEEVTPHRHAGVWPPGVTEHNAFQARNLRWRFISTKHPLRLLHSRLIAPSAYPGVLQICCALFVPLLGSQA